MQISVTFRQMETNQALKEYAEQKVSRVKKYLDNPLEANVIFSIQKHRHIADVTVVANGFTINGEEESQDLFSAIDLVMHKIERQIRKRKGKQTSHKSPTGGAGTVLIESSPLDEEDEENSYRIAKTTQVILKPMSIEEAVLELNLLKNDFLIFSDPESQMVNIIRRLKDGDFELIEAIPD